MRFSPIRRVIIHDQTRADDRERKMKSRRGTNSSGQLTGIEGIGEGRGGAKHHTRRQKEISIGICISIKHLHNLFSSLQRALT